jgi:hypothetical protein
MKTEVISTVGMINMDETLPPLVIFSSRYHIWYLTLFVVCDVTGYDLIWQVVTLYCFLCLSVLLRKQPISIYIKIIYAIPITFNILVFHFFKVSRQYLLQAQSWQHLAFSAWNLTHLRTDGDFCHEGWDIEMTKFKMVEAIYDMTSASLSIKGEWVSLPLSVSISSTKTLHGSEARHLPAYWFSQIIRYVVIRGTYGYITGRSRITAHDQPNLSTDPTNNDVIISNNGYESRENENAVNSVSSRLMAPNQQEKFQELYTVLSCVKPRLHSPTIPAATVQENQSIPTNDLDQNWAKAISSATSINLCRGHLFKAQHC